MKKFITTLFACLTIASVAYGATATSALVESLIEYEAIIEAVGSNPEFQSVIPATEFITNIDRLTKRVNTLGKVEYEIVTRVPRSHDTAVITTHLGCPQKKHTPRIHKYLAVLNVEPNPGIGPNIVTVVSIQPN